MNRIYIKKLVLRSEVKADAVLEFSQGFNAVTGASETGKSFAYSVINYALGASRIPVCPPEAIGYNQVFLELHDLNGNIYTLTRSLIESESDFVNIFYSAIDNFNLSAYDTYAVDSRAKRRLSDKLMRIIQCKYNNVRSSESGNTQSFTFRLFAHVLFIDENKIYAPHSPVLVSDSASDVANPPARYGFYTILRGIDYPKQESKIEKEKSKSELKGKIGQLHDLCNEMRVSIEKNRLSIGDMQLNQIQADIDRLKTLVFDQKEVLFEKQRAFDAKTQLIAELDERQFRIKQTIDKLQLLKINYQSDIDRLDFIEEAHSYSDQLVEVECPLCHTLAKPTVISDYKTVFYKSLKKEKEKLERQLLDLADTINSFNKEIESTSNLIIETREEREQLGEQIGVLMSHELAIALSNIDTLSQKRDELVKNEEQLTRVHEYEEKIKELEANLKNRSSDKKSIAVDFLSDGINNDFCSIIHQYLSRWNFSKEAVTFDNADTDVLVGIKKKRVYGQGARAIINSAFIISVLKFCLGRGLAHPGFVVLDSPLTTYKGRDTKPDDNFDDVANDVKDSFYNDLAKTTDSCQIIIFDNYDPSVNIEAAYHKIHFTGREDLGRQGFIPR